jgi:hypothetical protein
MDYLPRTGPLLLDCRTLDTSATVLRVRLLVARLRHGARRLEVKVATPCTADALVRWARRHRAPHIATPTESGLEVQIFLLPEEFGAPPLPSLGEGARPRITLAA